MNKSVSEIKKPEKKTNKRKNNKYNSFLIYSFYFTVGFIICYILTHTEGISSNLSGFGGVYFSLLGGMMVTAAAKSYHKNNSGDSKKDNPTAKKNRFNKTLKNIEDLQKIEGELLRAKKEAELLNDIIPSGVFTVNMEGRIKSWNRMAEKITGYSTAEVIGESCNKFALEPCKNSCGFSESKVVKPVIGANCKIRRKDGKVLDIMKNIDVICDDEGKIVGGIESFVDISEWKKSEKQLIIEKEKAQTYFDAVGTILIILNTDQTISAINRKGCEVFECMPENIVGINWFDNFIPEKKRDEIKSLFNRFVSSKGAKARYIETEAITKTGKRKIIAWNNTVTKDENGKIVSVLSSGEDITEKKQLQKEQELANEILKRISSLVVVASPNGKIKYVSPSVKDILGFEPKEMIGDGWWEKTNINQESVEKKKEYITLASQGKIPIAREPYTKDIKAKDGRRLHLLWKDSSGPDGDIIGVAQDVTARIDAEEKLAQSESRYRAIIEDQTEFIVRWKPDGTRIFVNEAYCRYFQENIKNIIGTNFFSLILEEDLPLVLEKIKKLTLLNPVGNPTEHRVKLPSGETRWNEWNDRGVFDEEGNLIEIQSVGRDITDRKFAEDALRKSEERFKSLYINSSIGIYRTTPEGRVLLCNPALIEMLQFNSFEEVSKIEVPSIYANKEDREKFLKILQKNGDIKGFEAEWLTNKGEKIFVRINGKAIKDEDGKVLVIEGSVEDVTEKKQAEQLVVDAKEKAEKSDRLKSEFLSQMSHEIRTPINAIMSFTSLIQDDIEDKIEEDIKTGFDIINRAGKRIIRTVDLMLNMAELKAGSYDFVPKEIDIHEEIVLGLFNEYKEAAEEKGLKFEMEVKTSDTIIFGDKYTINQIFMNLIDNAVKYTNEGEVKIILERDEESRLLMKIKDTGIGISKDYLNSIFEPFSQEDQGYARKYEGNGLGLALTQKYCELNYAEIKVESEKGSGSTFQVTFSKN